MSDHTICSGPRWRSEELLVPTGRGSIPPSVWGRDQAGLAGLGRTAKPGRLPGAGTGGQDRLGEGADPTLVLVGDMRWRQRDDPILRAALGGGEAGAIRFAFLNKVHYQEGQDPTMGQNVDQ